MGNKHFNFITQEQFIEKANLKHNFKYSYSLSIYNGYKNKIVIICPIHGEFSQRVNDHLSGCGCPKCGIESKISKKILSLEEFILRANKIHNNKYNYKLVSYKNAHTKVVISCDKHGNFEQSPANHLSGKGCNKCGRIKTIKFNSENPGGWALTSWINKAKKSTHFESFKVYILRCWNENEEFYKIGRTFNSVNRRFDSKKDIPYNWEILKILEGTAEEVFKLENRLKKNNKQNKYTPLIYFPGKHECFSQLKELKQNFWEEL
jgi:hypothetical protein